MNQMPTISAEDRNRIMSALYDYAARQESFGLDHEAVSSRRLASAIAPFTCYCGDAIRFDPEISDCGKMSCQMTRIARSDPEAAEELSAAIAEERL